MSKEYRSLYAGLVDHPKFLPLSADAKLVFFMAKLQLGASGIGILYPGTIAAQIGAGWDPDRVCHSLRELSAGGERAWIKMEANVVWIRKGLENEPQFTLSNPKHRKSVEKHLATLPKLPILNDFARAYGLAEPHPDLGVCDTLSDTLCDTGDREIGRNLPDADASGGEAAVVEEVIEADVEIVEPGPDEPRTGTGVQVIPLRRVALSELDLPFAEHEPEDALTAGDVMAEWIARKRPSLSRADRGRQAAAAARMVEGRTALEFMLAFVGIECVWPFAPPDVVKGSEGKLWDLMALEKNFPQAVDAAKNHPDVRRLRYAAEFEEARANSIWRTG